MRCCICGEDKEKVKFNKPGGATIRFKGGHMGNIRIDVNSPTCERCILVMQRLLAESKTLYPDKIRKAIGEGEIK